MNISQCTVCKSRQLKSVCFFPSIPVIDNILVDSADEAKKFACKAQNLVQCSRCGFIFNASFEPEEVEYNVSYYNERGHSVYYSEYIQNLAATIDSVMPLKDAHVLEIACGKGEFLYTIAEYQPKSCIGIDPSAANSLKENVIFEQLCFDQAYLTRMAHPADVLINRHMIEHILNPLEMLKTFNQALSSNGILYLETPRLNWILDRQAFYDFPYEHCAYYTDKFMERLLRLSGFQIVKMEFAYQGQYFSICARKISEQPISVLAEPMETAKVEQAFSEIMMRCQQISDCENILDVQNLFSTASKGLYLWGASAKGVMCANLLHKMPIAGFIDKNPFKQGKFIPGTGHKVLSPEDAIAKANIICVENEVYLSEIQNEVHNINPHIPVILLEELLQQ